MAGRASVDAIVGSARTFRLGAVLAVALGVGLVVWLLVERGNHSSSPSAVTTTPPVAKTPVVARPAIRSVAQLRSIAHRSSTPVYWVGARAGTKLEFTQTPSGALYVRYLPAGARAGDLRPFLTVATYPASNGFSEIEAAARRPQAQKIRLAGGGLAVYDAASSTNVHLAYPGQPIQIEVYAPVPTTATRLVSSGAVRPVD